MKGKLEYLILLGLVCAGFTWELRDVELPLIPAIYGIIGILALKFRRKSKPRLWHIEGILLFTGILAAYRIGDHLGPNRLLFVVNALAIYQLFRLFWPMGTRQRKYALAVSIMHLAVGSLVIVEPERFLVVLLLAIYLIPGAMCQIEAGKYHPMAGQRTIPQSLKQLAMIMLVMIAFFLFFPRMPGSRYLSQQGLMSNPGGEQSSELDMDSPSTAGDQRLLLRVHGDDLGYLRVDSLDTFDGMAWSRSHWSEQMQPRRNLNTPPTADMLFRKAKVFSGNALGNSLPTDYHVIGLEAPLRQNIYVSDHGGVKATESVPANVTYQYWTQKDEPYQDLRSTRHFQRYTDLSQFEPSPRLRQWLTELLKDESTESGIAQHLEQFFQANFQYELGTPNLNRLNPLDDFLFNERRGHCERYASAMAVLLRMEGIPARVGRGFVPAEYNAFGDFYNIRGQHAHAWTEAWLPDRGWVIYDATPYGVELPRTRMSAIGSIYEWIEENWYSRVVEFSREEQAKVLGVVGDGASLLGGFAVKNMPALLTGLLFATIVLFLMRINWKQWLRKNKKHSRADDIREVQSFYGTLLRVLARQQFYRAQHLTPYEFLDQLRDQGHPEIPAIDRITRIFCGVRYGNRELSAQSRQDIDAAFKALRSSRARGPGN